MGPPLLTYVLTVITSIVLSGMYLQVYVLTFTVALLNDEVSNSMDNNIPQ